MAKELVTTKKKIGIIKHEEREAYKLWASIPAMVRLLPEADLKKMGYDTDDPVFMKLITLRTKKEFTEFFKIGHSQPMLWEKEDGWQEDVTKLSKSMNVMKFAKDIDFSFTQKVLKHGDAHRMKLWKQLYEGWTEKSENVNINANFNVIDMVKEIEARNKKLRAEEGL